MSVQKPKAWEAAAQTHAPAAQAAPPSPAVWRLRLLGAVELLNPQGLPVRLPTRAATLLLARLALAPRSQHPREELTELLWPDAQADVGRNRLRQALSVLRSLLEAQGAASGPVLVADRRAVWLHAGALTSDVDALARAWAQGDAARARELFQGDLLPGHFDEWVLDERRHLAARTEALGVARQPVGQPGSLPPAMVPEARLPRYLTRLFGFEAEGAALAAHMARQRLVVLRGPGGAGKTRLAVEVTSACVQRADGRLAVAGADAVPFDLVAFVPLASCRQRQEMLDLLLHTLHQDSAGEASDAAARITTALAGRRVLLVLDNFEQLVEGGRDDLAHWLSALPQLHLLVTSRRTLGLDGEVEYALPALPLPAADGSLQATAMNPAVALFVDRARALRADFALTDDNQALVADTVRALGGLPLALELAAARVRSLGLRELHTMLVSTAAPGASLALLARAGPRGADDARHASMLHVLQWSWQQLTAEEQALLSALAVCEEGAGLPLLACLAQQAALPAALLVDGLVSSSVAYQRVDKSGSSRYQVFEPMRELVFVQAGADGLAALRAHHASAVATWAGKAGADPDLGVVRGEWANLMRALASAATAANAATAQQAIDTVLALRPALEDLPLPASALDHLELAARQQPQHRAALLHGILAYHCFEAGLRQRAGQHAAAAVAAAATPRDRAEALRLAARVQLRLGLDPVPVLALVEESIALARAHGQMDVLPWALTTRSVLQLRLTRDFEANLRAHQEIVGLWRQHGPRRRVTSALAGLALALGFLHRVPEQLVLLAETRAEAAQHGQHRLLAFVQSITGYALADQRRYAESAQQYRQCLQLAWGHASWREWFYVLWNLPRTLAHLRRPGPAAQLMGFAEAFYAQRFGVLGAEDLPEARRTRRLAAAQLGWPATLQLWTAGAGLTMAEAQRLAMDESAGGGSA